jgi:hypothetical protein
MNDETTIQANFDNKVEIRNTKFSFRKDDLGNKRPTVELPLRIPSVEGIIAILEAGGKQLELLQDAVADYVIGQARGIVNDKEDINADNFPWEQTTWEFISNLPPKERRGGGIPKEAWEAFVKDYIAVMPAVTGKTIEQVSNAAKILLNKFNAVKTQKPVIKLLKEQLGLYITNTTEAESYAECVDFLINKADTLLNMSEADLLANL